LLLLLLFTMCFYFFDATKLNCQLIWNHTRRSKVVAAATASKRQQQAVTDMNVFALEVPKLKLKISWLCLLHRLLNCQCPVDNLVVTVEKFLQRKLHLQQLPVSITLLREVLEFVKFLV